MSLHDELAHLTSAQPAQPGDRLTSVTGKARRMKRTRNALALAAVVAVAAPVGVLAATVDRSPAKVDYAASPTTWPDRSSQADRSIADTAPTQWAAEGNGFTTTRWLYRGKVLVPGGTAVYVVAFVSDDKVVMGFGELKTKDDNGQTRPPAVDGWQLKGIDAKTAPPVLSLYLPRLNAGPHDDNWLFALAAPKSRELTWDATPVPFAPTGTVEHGSLRSTDGVFQGWTGRLAGRLTAHVGDITTPLSFPDADPQLTPVADAPEFRGGVGIVGGSGQLDEDSASTGYGGDGITRPMRLRVICYGGGTLTAYVNDVAGGRATCDATEHVVTLPASPGQLILRLKGDSLQVYSFVLERT